MALFDRESELQRRYRAQEAFIIHRFEVFRRFGFHIQFDGVRPNPNHPTRPTILFRSDMGGKFAMRGEVRVADDGSVR